jgi:hypothetical protein
MDERRHQPSSTSPTEPASPGEIDPVCGMTVQPERAASMVQHHDQPYYFL